VDGPEAIITGRGLAKVYALGGGLVRALAGVDLTVQAGEMVAVMGPSGSGKSTLLHILGCLDTPTQGTYRLAGREVSGLSDRELSRIRCSQIGFVFQSFHLIPQLNLLENVALPFCYHPRTSPAAARARAAQALDRVGLADRLRHRPAELSGGELQRAAIARAMAVEPAILLADEPTGNLDSKSGQKVLNVFQRLHLEEATILVATHDPAVAAGCSRIIHLRDGRLAEERE